MINRIIRTAYTNPYILTHNLNQNYQPYHQGNIGRHHCHNRLHLGLVQWFCSDKKNPKIAKVISMMDKAFKKHGWSKQYQNLYEKLSNEQTQNQVRVQIAFHNLEKMRQGLGDNSQVYNQWLFQISSNVLLQSDQFQRPIKLLQQCLQNSKKYSQLKQSVAIDLIPLIIGRAYYQKKKDYEQAKKWLLKFKSQHTNLQSVQKKLRLIFYQLLGKILIDNNQLKLGISCYQAVADDVLKSQFITNASENQLRMTHDLSLLYYKNNQKQKGIQVLQKIQSKLDVYNNQKDLNLMLILYEYYSMMNEKNQQINILQKAIKVLQDKNQNKPQNLIYFKCLANLTSLYYIEENYEKSIQTVKKLLKVLQQGPHITGNDFNMSQWYLRLSAMELFLGKEEQGIHSLKQSLKCAVQATSIFPLFSQKEYNDYQTNIKTVFNLLKSEKDKYVLKQILQCYDIIIKNSKFGKLASKTLASYYGQLQKKANNN